MTPLSLAQRSIVFCLLLFALAVRADTVPRPWAAEWIAAPDGPARDYSVLYFRKTLSLSAVPEHLVVDVSADTRFELHVNGQRVGAGPALADVHHWRYEVFDLSPFLHTGGNTIASVVWNFGTSAAVAQMSSRTAFLLSAEDPKNADIDTGHTTARPTDAWMVQHESGRRLDHIKAYEYYAAGPPELMDGRQMQWNWDGPPDGQSGWTPAAALGQAAPNGARNSPTPWILEKDPLPQMKYAPVSAGKVVRVSGSTPGSQAGPQIGTALDNPITIPAQADVTLLLDRGVLTTAFPSLQLQGGQNASVALTYAEALYDDKGKKGDRDQIEGRHIEGVQDQIISDGGDHTYRTFWWRCWRYLQVEVKTADTPLTIKKLNGFYTAYPFQKTADFASDDPELTRIWDVGWRTAQLCAHETYMDTPYWEQLQYVGDTRIQALVSYAVTGDDRLARQAMMAYRDSLLTDGLTQSRYPSSLTQVIPPFSLMWVGMLRDFWMYRDDPAFVTQMLPSTRGVLDWFSARQRADGLLGPIEWWPFVDWTDQYPDGVPPQEADGGSSALTLQFIEGLRDAAAMETQLGESDRAARYEAAAKRASDALMRLNWDEQHGLLADTPAKKSYSQQANALAVWLDVVPATQQKAVMEKLLAEHSAVSIAPASYYFRFYLARAMVHAGLGDQYIAQLTPWRNMLAMHLSTWAEMPEPTRSDSHAWSAHPTYDLLTTVAGIAPASPLFASVRIAPHLAELHSAAATLPTPKGPVSVRYRKNGIGWKAEVTLPDGLPGELVWRDRSIALHAGPQVISLP